MFTDRERALKVNKRLMNKAATQLKRETRFLIEALDAFGRTTGLKAKVLGRKPRAEKGKQPDAEVTIENAGKRYRYLVELKAADRKVVLAHAKRQIQAYGRQGMLIAPYLTPELANYCRELDLQFIDAAGNAYVRAPGLYVYNRGERMPAIAGKAAGARAGGTAAALRVVFALLCNPVLLNAPYREIAAAARVALGTVGWVFEDLERRGFVIAGKKERKRRLLNPMRLVEEWVTNYPIKLRTKLAVRRFRAADPDWWRTARLHDYRAAWGGEVAADRLTGNREPAVFTVYLRGDPAKFILDHKLRADPNGEVEILEQFWNFQTAAAKDHDVAPPLLVYADLMATLDPRNHATAKLVHERLLANAFDKA